MTQERLDAIRERLNCGTHPTGGAHTMKLIRKYTADDLTRHDTAWLIDAPVYLAEDFECATIGRLMFTRDAFIPGVGTVHKWIRRHTSGRLRRLLLVLDAAVYTTHGGLALRRVPFVWLAWRRPDAPERDTTTTTEGNAKTRPHTACRTKEGA